MVERKRSSFKMDMRIKPDGKKAAPVKPEERPCGIKDCATPGLCRVPKSREDLSDYIWLCTGHARQHNESWDFFKGMDNGDIQKFREDALTGHRPTWALNKHAAKVRNGQGPLHF